MLLKDAAKRFDEIYEIYQEAFPPIERRTKEGQREVLEHPCYYLRVKEDEGQIVAFLGYWILSGCVFLEHLATSAVCRGKGYGKQLVEECLQEAEQSGKPVFLEIEPITKEEPMTGRRADFYERLGFKINPFPYEQMPLKPEDSPCPLWIMSYGTNITEREFLPYKKEIYREVYQAELKEQA